MASGEEIIAIVEEWPEEKDPNIIIKQPLRIAYVEDAESGMEYLSFRPWVLDQLQDGIFQSVNLMQVIAKCTPTPDSIEKYVFALEKYMGSLSEESELRNMIFEDDLNTDSESMTGITHEINQKRLV